MGRSMILLFDIDGTLILSDNAGRRAVERALLECFGIATAPRVPYAGRTDQFIFRRLLTAAGLAPSDENFLTLREAYVNHLPASLAEGRGQVLPGVESLLRRLATDQRCQLGLLTGNLPESALLKLQHFGLDHFFSFGVYGDHSEDRRDLAFEASQIIAARFGLHSADSIWIIGDTQWDVLCGRHISARTLACCTGSENAEQLTAAGACHVVETLSDTEAIVRILLDDLA